MNSRVFLATSNKINLGTISIWFVLKPVEMSSRLISVPKLNHVSSFQYFFSNSNKFLNFNSFILNQFLSSLGSRHAAASASGYHNKTLNDGLINSVTRRVLTCQDSTPDITRDFLTSMTNRKMPFQVTPKAIGSNRGTRQSTKQSRIKSFVKLTKPNLTVLVTLSSICSYAISPNSVSVGELALLTLGTALCSGSANAINMGREPDFDKMMPRTSTRPVVTGLITPKQAFQFAAVSGSLGSLILYFGVNPTVSFLSVINIGLYAWLYTSLKRRSILNTWVGAVVGAIPPLMGWAASSSLAHPGCWCLAALLYAWQFPHFNALSHNIADQYKQAGYVMTAAENPKLNARVALRYSLLMFPICFGLSYFGVTDWVFPFDSGIANGWMSILAYRFWRQQRQNYSPGHTPTPEAIQLANSHARKLFWCSVWQLPVVLVLAMLHKKGQWDRLWNYLGFKESTNNKPATLPA